MSVFKCWRSPRKVKSSSFLSERQIAQKESFQSIFPPKTHRNTHEQGKRLEAFLAFKNFALLCALFFDAGAEICESSLHTVTSLDSHHMKENNTEQTTSLKTVKKIYGYEMSPVCSGKATTNPSSLLR